MAIIKLERVSILGDLNLHIDVDTSIPALLSVMEVFNFRQHPSGPAHSNGHTRDPVFSLGLQVSNLCVKEWPQLCVPWLECPSGAPASLQRVTEENYS